MPNILLNDIISKVDRNFTYAKAYALIEIIHVSGHVLIVKCGESRFSIFQEDYTVISEDEYATIKREINVLFELQKGVNTTANIKRIEQRVIKINSIILTTT